MACRIVRNAYPPGHLYCSHLAVPVILCFIQLTSIQFPILGFHLHNAHDLHLRVLSLFALVNFCCLYTQHSPGGVLLCQWRPTIAVLQTCLKQQADLQSHATSSYQDQVCGAVKVSSTKAYSSGRHRQRGW